MLFTFMLLCSCFYHFNSKKSIEIENKIYAMYVSNFENYLEYKDNLLVVNEDKIKEDIEKMNCDVIFYGEQLHFKIKSKFPYKYEKEYYFYLENSNE